MYRDILALGKNEGKLEGKLEGIELVALNLILSNVSDDDVCKYTNLTLARVRELRKENTRK